MKNIKGLIGSIGDFDDKHELFEYLLEEEGLIDAETERISRLEDRSHLSLSYGQERMWFLQQMEPLSPAYNMAGAVMITGRLEIEELERSISEIVRRHEVLRTTYEVGVSGPVQKINPPEPFTLAVTDLSALPEQHRSARLTRIETEEARRPFDLSRDLMLRARLVCLSERQYEMLVVMHHIASDGWSIGVMLRELGALYDTYSKGGQPPLAEPDLQYGDYAHWERRWLRSGVIDRQLEYWKKQLAGELPVLSLPVAHSRSVAQSFEGTNKRIRLSDEASLRVREMSRQQEVTPFILLLSCYVALLYRLSGQEEVVIGTPVANRNRKEIEGLIGLFVNMLALRVKVSGTETFQQLLKRVKEVAVEAYSNQDLPFEKLVEELRPERSLSRTPLFQVTFAMESGAAPAMKAGEVNMQVREVESGIAKFDLNLTISDRGEQMEAAIDYRRGLYEEAMIERMLDQYERMLSAVVKDSSEKIGEIEILSAREREQIVGEWNETSSWHDRSKTIQEMIEEQAERRAEEAAIEYEGEVMSYAELNERANKIGRYLRGKGVGAEVKVGICMERGMAMAAALIGILKAGGAYVPLDPSYPKERIHFMMKDAEVKVTLTEQRLAAVLDPQADSVICLDSEWDLIASEDGRNFASGATPSNLVYIIYTSGSTGRPKGVMLDQSGIINCLLWMQSAFDLNDDDKVIFKAPLSFDASVWELFWPLIVGARVIIARPGGQQDSAYLANLISERKATTVHFVPSMLGVFLEEDGIERLESLKRVICGGEALPAEAMERYFDRVRAELHNFYGPTETSIGSIDWRCARGGNYSSVPIGRPIFNTQVFILNEQLLPQPVGVTGELFVGGEGLARGYLNRAELTAEKFIPDPFASEPGARLYRTGDLARFLPDGNIEFLGRIDHQVKVRGFRIELGEIEAAIGQHPEVRETIVLLREDAANDKRLVAYVVPQESASISSNQLRSFLRDRLPDYMIPSAFVVMEEMPLTPNLKVDRRALPVPDTARPDLEQSYIAPRNPVEELIAVIWSAVLGVEQVGIHDDFFDVGGHSLLATQVVLRLRDAFQIEVPLPTLFEHSTIAGLAEFVQAETRAGRRLRDLPILPVSRDELLPLSFAQRRLWFLDQLETDRAVYNMAAGERLIGRLDVAAFRRALGELVRRHESLRTTFAVVEGEPVQIIAQEHGVALNVIDLSCLPEQQRESEARRIAEADAQNLFDLERGPLMRVSLLRLAEEDSLLVFVIHHIVTDGWSIGILTRELAAIYEAFSRGEPSPLPPLPIQYADFAVWQRACLNGEVVREQLQYWKKQLGGTLPALELPTDRPRPPTQSFRGAVYTFALSPDLFDRLKPFSRQENVTLFMALVATFQTLLFRYTKQEDISVGSPIANRSRVELEGLIGFFANTLVIRTDLSGDPPFRELLRRVREVAVGAYSHQDLPFEMLVEELQPGRDLSYSPLFQVMFALQNTPRSELRLRGLKLDEVDVPTGKAHFDLTLFMAEESSRILSTFEYNTDLFDAATIYRMAEHFEVLLAGILSDPERSISRFSIMKEEEREQVIYGWNKREAAPGSEALIQDLFERQVERTPDHPAVEMGGERLSYSELNRRANQFARYLRRNSIGAESVVGICLSRGIEMIVAVLGVMKSGAAYAAVDAEYPKERLRWMLQAAAAVVVERGTREKVSDAAAEQICIDEEWEQISRESLEESERRAQADNLAYLVYTSGSTGSPKGVAMTQGSIANMIRWQIESSTATIGTRTLQFASFSFDVSFQEIFSTLCTGGKLLMIPEETRRDGAELVKALEEKGVERLFVPLVALQQIAEESEARGLTLSSLREVMAAGEQLKITPEIRRLFMQSDGCTLYNHYGPSETHAATALVLAGPASEWPLLPSIGNPIDHARVYILDHNLQSVPIGVIGEIYIGGEGLARGYMNRPAFTAESFMPDPFSEAPGARMYKSGDSARWLSDGNIEFLGRIDRQVKVRGFRVEPGEIETVLRGHTAVSDAVVTAWEYRPGEKRLVAYIVNEAGVNVSGSKLRDFLRGKLPDYMVPSAFETLDRLPLTPSGKVDHRALPAPDMTRQSREEGYVAPRNPIEEAVAAIWAQVLEVREVGIYDSFFEMGGHSLLATRLTSQLRTAFQAEIPLRRLFEHPTIAGIAESIEAELKSERDLKSPPLVAVSRDRELPLSYGQERMWFLQQMEPLSPAYNMAGAVMITGRLEIEELERAISEIVRRHEVLRTTYEVGVSGPVQKINPPRPVAMPLDDISGLPHNERQLLAKSIAAKEAAQPFDLSHEMTLRTRLIRLSEDLHELVIVTHHIASDGWSIGVMLKELAALYRAYAGGEEPPLERLSIQYADFAVWHREWLKGEVIEKQLEYWRKQLAGDLPVLSLATDHARAAVKTIRGSSKSMRLGKEVSEAVAERSRQLGLTKFMYLLGCYAILLHKYSGQEQFMIGTPVANRSSKEVEKLIGFFVNTLVLRVRVKGVDSVRELMMRVKEVAIGAYSNQEMPFEKLVEEINPERDLSHSPLFQVTFAMQSEQAMDVNAGEVQMKLAEVESEIAKFDLSLVLAERDGEMEAAIEYNRDLYEEETIGRMLRHYEQAVKEIIREEDLTVADIQILTPQEREQILREWNQTSKSYDSAASIQQMIEEQASLMGEAQAVWCEGEALTYAELNQRANKVARYLRRNGVSAEARVGVCVSRGVEMIVTLLGVLKAGGAYVPLDPSYPKQRLAFMLEDAGASLVLTQERFVENLSGSRAQSICLDSDWEAISFESDENFSSGATEQNIAYVIYTSGSTGQPKGVAVERRQLLNYVRGILDRLDVVPGSSFATVSTIAADLGNTVIYSSLCTGGRLHILSEHRAFDALAFADYFDRHEIDYLKIVPSHLAALKGASSSRQVMPRKMLILGGEASHAAWVEALQSSAPDCAILNHYGPTETTVGALTYRFGGERVSTRSLTLPVGRPIANAQAYILDSYMQPAPIGVSGELFIGGDGVARGYLNRPGLTAERFMPDSFSQKPGARLYRTGDLARYLPDGNVEFLGRIDDQVKIRGFRIELDEIESVLKRHAAVRDAAVVMRASGDDPNDKRLIAYVMPKPERALTINGQQRYKLPNNLAVAHLNKNETDYLYKEIFELQAYLRHGITLKDGDCIFDVGANIGLFTLFAHQACERPVVYAFEPNPHVFKALSANAHLYAEGVKLFDCGLASEAKTADFTFFPGFSLLSGLYADAETEKRLVKTFMLNQQRLGTAEMSELIEQADEILEDRFKPEVFAVRLKTISSLIAEEGIERINLLKINVEKSELDVLSGIEDADWKRIEQIVVEVDVKENLDAILSLLANHGYEFVVEQDRLLNDTPLCYVYAVRPSRGRALVKEQGAGEHAHALPQLPEPFLSSVELRQFLSESLPDYMVPASFVILDEMPLTPNGKIDRRKLSGLESRSAGSASAYVAPGSEMERIISAIWQELLHVEKVGLYDNFFELGGHSLLIIQVCNRLRAATRTDVSVIELFRHPTVSALADYLNRGAHERQTTAENRARGAARRRSIAERTQRRKTGSTATGESNIISGLE